MRRNRALILGPVTVDDIAISVDDFPAFLHNVRNVAITKVSPRSSDAHVAIHQGNIYAVMGPRGCGRSTLLQLLAGVIFPPVGEATHVYMPSHLRVLWLAHAAQFFSRLPARELAVRCQGGR